MSSSGQNLCNYSDSDSDDCDTAHKTKNEAAFNFTPFQFKPVRDPPTVLMKTDIRSKQGHIIPVSILKTSKRRYSEQNSTTTSHGSVKSSLSSKNESLSVSQKERSSTETKSDLETGNTRSTLSVSQLNQSSTVETVPSDPLACASVPQKTSLGSDSDRSIPLPSQSAAFGTIGVPVSSGSQDGGTSFSKSNCCLSSKASQTETLSLENKTFASFSFDIDSCKKKHGFCAVENLASIELKSEHQWLEMLVNQLKIRDKIMAQLCSTIAKLQKDGTGVEMDVEYLRLKIECGEEEIKKLKYQLKKKKKACDISTQTTLATEVSKNEENQFSTGVKETKCSQLNGSRSLVNVKSSIHPVKVSHANNVEQDSSNGSKLPQCSLQNSTSSTLPKSDATPSEVTATPLTSVAPLLPPPLPVFQKVLQEAITSPLFSVESSIPARNNVETNASATDHTAQICLSAVPLPSESVITKENVNSNDVLNMVSEKEGRKRSNSGNSCDSIEMLEPPPKVPKVIETVTLDDNKDSECGNEVSKKKVAVENEDSKVEAPLEEVLRLKKLELLRVHEREEAKRLAKVSAKKSDSSESSENQLKKRRRSRSHSVERSSKRRHERSRSHSVERSSKRRHERSGSHSVERSSKRRHERSRSHSVDRTSKRRHERSHSRHRKEEDSDHRNSRSNPRHESKRNKYEAQEKRKSSNKSKSHSPSYSDRSSKSSMKEKKLVKKDKKSDKISDKSVKKKHKKQKKLKKDTKKTKDKIDSSKKKIKKKKSKRSKSCDRESRKSSSTDSKKTFENSKDTVNEHTNESSTEDKEKVKSNRVDSYESTQKNSAVPSNSDSCSSDSGDSNSSSEEEKDGEEGKESADSNTGSAADESAIKTTGDNSETNDSATATSATVSASTILSMTEEKEETVPEGQESPSAASKESNTVVGEETFQDSHNFQFLPEFHLYYDSSSGYYYDAVSRIYYDSKNSSFCYYDDIAQRYRYETRLSEEHAKNFELLLYSIEANSVNGTQNNAQNQSTVTEKVPLVNGNTNESIASNIIEKLPTVVEKSESTEKSSCEEGKESSLAYEETLRQRIALRLQEKIKSSEHLDEEGSEEVKGEEDLEEERFNAAYAKHLEHKGLMSGGEGAIAPSLRLMVVGLGPVSALPDAARDGMKAPFIIMNSKGTKKLETLHVVTVDGAGVGRMSKNGVHLPHISVSKEHAEIIYGHGKDSSYSIRDLGSNNGTFVNGTRLSASKTPSQPTELGHGWLLNIGEVQLQVHMHPSNLTCNQCEPGLVTNVMQSSPGAITGGKGSSQEECRRSTENVLRKKYGLGRHGIDNSCSERVTSSCSYSDRSQARRIEKGSDNPYEKTEVASVHEFMSSNNKGFKLLKKMGWEEGAGLGKDGRVDPVLVEAQQEGVGLGAEQNPLKDSSLRTKVNKLTKQRFGSS